MRTAGFAPSLGAGGSLVAAAAVVALLASALLAFHDWPSGSARGDTGTATLPGVAPHRVAHKPAARHRSTAPVAGATAVARRSAPAARPARRSGTPALRPAGGTRRGQAPVSATVPSTTSPAPAPARSPSPPAATRPAPTPTPAPTATGVVGRTVQTVRKVVAPVVKALPAPVQAPVNAVGDTVQKVGDGVDGALGEAGIRLP
jgi:hypothetical protein